MTATDTDVDAETRRRAKTSQMTPRTRARLLHIEGLTGEHGFMKDNLSIRSGYRVEHSVYDAFASLFTVHNEMVNVWSHLLGSFLFIALLLVLVVHDVSDPTVVGPSAVTESTECGVPAPAFMLDGHHTGLALVSSTLLPHEPSLETLASHAHFPSLLHLQLRLNHLKDAAKSGQSAAHNAVLSFEESLLSLKDHIHSLQVDVTQEAVSKMKTLVGAVEDELVFLEDKLVAFSASAGSTTRHVLHDLKATGQKLVDRAEAFVADKLDDPPTSVHPVAKWPLFVFLLSAAVCLACSATFHLLGCVSIEWWSILAPVDYSGISSLIAGSSIAVFYYAFMCNQVWFYLHLTLCVAINLTCVFVNLIPRFKTSDFRNVRVAMFIASGVYGVAPLLQLSFFDNTPFNQWLAWRMVQEGLLYVTGAFLYAFRFPECISPGTFDTFFSSHQLFHLLVVIAALHHWNSVLAQYHFRAEEGCPA